MKKTNPHHERLALIAGMVALFLGASATILFYDFFTLSYLQVGLGFTIFIGILLGAIGIVTSMMRMPFRFQVWWLSIPIIFFSIMVAVRAELTLTLFNMLMVIALGGLLLHYLPTEKFLHQENTPAHLLAIISSSLYALFGSLMELYWIQNSLKNFKWTGNESSKAVLRGIFFAVPVLLVFCILLASADSVFSDFVTNIFAGMIRIDDLIGRVFLMVVFTWFALGLLAYGARMSFEALFTLSSEKKYEVTPEMLEVDPSISIGVAPSVEPSSVDTSSEKSKSLPPLGMIETTIVMGSVIALFGVFVLIQFTYLFGGQNNIGEGITYAQYARRGFFELVVVAVLVIGLGRYLHMQTRRQSTRATLLFRVESVVLIALTLLLLASAWHRMSLYESAFGFTHLRLYVYVFMLALVALIGVFLLEVFTQGKTIFSFGVILTIIGYGVVLNLVGGEGFIAERNINRYAEAKDLDICYLQTFSVDALPQMLRLLEIAQQKQDTELQEAVQAWLSKYHEYVLRQEDFALITFNLSHRQAQTLFTSFSNTEIQSWNKKTDLYCYR